MKRIFVLTSFKLENDLAEALEETEIPLVYARPETEDDLFDLIARTFHKEDIEEVPDEDYSIICADRQYLEICHAINHSTFYAPTHRERSHFKAISEAVETESLRIINFLKAMTLSGEVEFPEANVPLDVRLKLPDMDVHVRKTILDVGPTAYYIEFKDPSLFMKAKVSEATEDIGRGFRFNSGSKYTFKEVVYVR